jgi:hypothetical protein
MRRYVRELLAIAALMALGCEEELGPEPMPTTRVVGKVHIRSKPVSGGWIEFHPFHGTVGLLRSARLRPDGTFEADRVAIGESAIQISNSPIPLPGAIPALRQPSPLEMRALIRRDIKTVPETTIDIDLQDEYIRILRENANRP